MEDNVKKFFDLAVEINTYGFFDIFVKYSQNENRVLDMLSRSSDVVLPSYLSEKLQLSRVSVTLTLNSLESKGLIKRELSLSDRRKVNVSITKKGEEVLEIIREEAYAFIKNLFAIIGVNKCEQLMDIMNDIYTYVKGQ